MALALNWDELAPTSPLLAALTGKPRQLSRLVELSSGEQLFTRGDRPAAMYFVRAGEVRLIRLSRAGNEIVLQRTRHGFFAEASLDQRAYHCSAVAIVRTELLAIPRKAFNDALSDETFRQRWFDHLARELRQVRAQAERLSLKTARERILRFIETEGDASEVVLTQSKKDWAAELGLTHEAIYRALSQLQRDGELDVSGSRLQLT